MGTAPGPCPVHGPRGGAVPHWTRPPVSRRQRAARVDRAVPAPVAGSGGGALGQDPMAIARWDEVEGAEPDEIRHHLLPPVRPAEVWAAGVTYERSLTARK